MRRWWLLLLFVTALPAAAQYRWTDREGRVSYGDHPPTDARDVRRVTPGGGSAAAPAATPLPFELQRAVERFPVTLYTTAPCGPCDQGRALLSARGIPFSERTVSTAEDAQALRALAGDDRLPALSVGRQTAVGFQAESWNALLDAGQYPAASRLPRGWRGEGAQPLVPSPPAAAPGSSKPVEEPAPPQAR